MVSAIAFDRLPRLPRAVREAGSSRHAAGASVDRKLPSGPAAIRHEVLPERPVTVIVTSSPARKPAPHTTAPIVIGGAAATIGCRHSRMRAWPAWGTIGCGGSGPGQPMGFALIGLAVTGGHRFGARDGGVIGWSCVGAAPDGGAVTVSRAGAAVAATADPSGLDVAPAPRLVGADDVQAALNNPISKIALNVACLVMVIGL